MNSENGIFFFAATFGEDGKIRDTFYIYVENNRAHGSFLGTSEYIGKHIGIWDDNGNSWIIHGNKYHVKPGNNITVTWDEFFTLEGLL